MFYICLSHPSAKHMQIKSHNRGNLAMTYAAVWLSIESANREQTRFDISLYSHSRLSRPVNDTMASKFLTPSNGDI